MALAELGNFLQPCRQPLELAVATQPLYGAQLIVCRTARPNEIRVVGVCETVGARSRRGHHRSFLEEEHRLICSGKRKDVGDRVEPLRVRQRVPAAVQNSEPSSFLLGDAGEKPSSIRPRAPDLEMRGAGPAEGPTAEERTSDIGASTARARDDATGRVF